MDTQNLFHTRTTFNLMRLDYTVGLIALSALVLLNASEVNWVRFVIAFAWIDLVGYLPGAILYRAKNAPRPLPPLYSFLYNTTHSFATNAIVILVWRYLVGEYEWAMLALPIHLLGDRGLFGNVYKPFALSFEPESHPAFARFSVDFNRSAG